MTIVSFNVILWSDSKMFECYYSAIYVFLYVEINTFSTIPFYLQGKRPSTYRSHPATAAIANNLILKVTTMGIVM